MSDDKIFKSSESSLKDVKEDLVSFKDCPNKCIAGYYVDPYKHKKVRCKYCDDKRKIAVKEVVLNESEDTIADKLNLPASFIGTTCDVDSIFPKFVIKDIKEDSLRVVKNVVTDFINKATIGDLLDDSVMFNFGKKAYEFNFIYPLMMNYYLAGRTVAPLMSPLDVCRLRNEAEKYIYSAKGDTFTYYDLLSKDICVVLIDAGVKETGIDAVKGLMQLRANKSKATIMITNAWGSRILDMCSEGSERSLNLATLYSVEYTEKYVETETRRENTYGKQRSGKDIVGISSDAFNSLMSAKNTL